MSDVSVRMTLTDDVSSKLNKISNSVRTVASNFSGVGKAMDSAFSSKSAVSFASQTESAFDSVEKDVHSLGNAIDEAVSGFGDFSFGNTGRMESVFSDASESAADLAESVSQASESVDDLSGSAGNLGDGTSGLGELSAQADDVGNSMEQASSKAINFGSALKVLFAAVSAAAIIGQVKDFATDSISIGKDYTSMMSEVAAISGASATDIAMMEQTAREYGATTVFSASEAAEALKYMSLAGWDAQQSSDALGGVLNLAAASGMELGQASDMVTDYLSAFGMQASESTYFADMLAYAQSNSNTTAMQLGEAYRNSAANLHAAGQDVETTTSLLEAMANQGYKGSEAGTALAATMRDITQNMEDGAIMIGDTSVAVQDSTGNFRDLTDILTDVESATEGMGDAQKAAALGSTFTSDSIKALNMILTEGMDKVSGYEDELRKAGGTSEKMAEIMNDNLAGDISNMESAYEEMQLQVFEALEEPLRDGAQYLTGSVIPILTEWVPDVFGSMANGIQKVGSALSPLIDSVLKNPQAVGAAFASIGAGFAAMKTVSTGFKIADSIKNAGGLASALGKLSNGIFGSPWAAGAAAVTAALAGIGLAIDAYNDKQISNSLEKHFGNVQLSDEQVSDVAGNILDADYLVNINAALGEFENADKFKAEAEAALQSNDALEWKCRVGISLTPEEQQDYLSNIEGYVESSIGELESRTYAAHLTVSTLLTSPDGQSLADNINKWAADDMASMSQLSGQLTNLVQDALTDGMIDVNEQAAIDILQGKINSIMSGWQDAEAQAEMDLLTQKYGRLSGKDLTEDTFTEIVSELGEQRMTAMEALDSSQKELYGVLNGLESSGRITSKENQMYKAQAGEAYRNSQAEGLMNSVNFESNTLSDTYGEKLEANFASMQKSTQKSFDNMNNYLQNQDYNALTDSLAYGFNQAMTGTGIFSDGDQQALSQFYETMKPDVTALGEMIDTYAEAGQSVPQQVMDSFNEAMQIGAASGDTDAAWQLFANQMIADPANKALIDAIDQGTVQVPEELRKSLDRATVKTTDEPITIDGMRAELEGMEVDDSKVQDLLAKSLEGLSVTGETSTINGVATVEYEVTAGQTMSEIAAQAGIALDELVTANPQIQNPNLIQIGQKVNIPSSAVEVDASGVAEKTEQVLQSEAGGDSTVEKTVTANTTYVAGETDTSQVQDTATEQLSSETATQEVVTNTEYIPGTTDTSQVTSATETALSEQIVEGTATANVTSQCGTDNFAETTSSFANRFQSALIAAFARTFTATTNASITVNYSIANPSKTITFSGGGSGTATVYAHASGGIFESPHYGLVAEAGPEAIIPLDGSGNALSLWAQTGERLGVLEDNPITTVPVDMQKRADMGTSSDEKSSSRDINLNINGNGKIQVGGGVSKADVLQVLIENVKGVLMGILQDEILTEGDGSYEY